MWLAMALQRWTGFDVDGPLPFPASVQGPDGSPGFLVVYETREAALEAVGGDASRVLRLGFDQERAA